MSLLYLVDGSGYIFRAFYAIAPLSTHQGLPTNALFGFTRMLGKLLREVEEKNAKIAVAFDTAAPTFRHEMYSEYKANRSECPEELVPQMPYFQKIVEALGIKVLIKEGVEADDLIATVAVRATELGDSVRVVSGDKDLTQLVSDKVAVWDAMRDIEFTPKRVKEKFGVTPEQIVDFLALTGDSSDNVPGVKGIGEKSAQRLIQEFGSVEQMLENTAQIEEISDLRGRKSIRTKIESGQEMLRLSQQLVILDKKVPPYNGIEDVGEFAWEAADTESLVPLFKELEFHDLLGTMQQNFPAKISGIGPSSASDASKNYKIVDAATLKAFVEQLSTQSAFAFDTETTSLDVRDCELVGISISWCAEEAYYLPLAGKVEKERHLDPEQVRELLNPVLANPLIKKVGLNLKYDVGVLEEHGYEVCGEMFDAMLASYVLNPDKRQHGLKALARIHLGETMVTYEELVGEAEDIASVAIDQVGHYACHDADASWKLYEALSERLDEAGEGELGSLWKVFREVEMPLVTVLSRMERRGIKLDVAVVEELEKEFSEELAELESSIILLADGEFNLNSPKQLAEVLFERLGIPTKGVKKTKSGYSTNAAVLSKLAPQYEIVEKILDYRELFKLKSTYLDSLKRLVNPETSRVYSTFNQAVAATGRLSSSDPNMQNIPIRTARGRKIREAFVAEDDSILVSADYSQIELRILAHLAGDKNLRKAFINDEDIHMATAKDIFGAIGSEEDFKNWRRIAKIINFGIIYGMSAFRLANELGISRGQAQEYIDEYFGRYPKVEKYFDLVAEQAEERGYVETLFGRRRYTQDIDSSGRDAGYAMRSLLNAPIQGSAAEIIKLAMINLSGSLNRFSGEANMVLQVHDELVFEVNQSLAADVEEHVREEMEQVVNLEVPLKVDIRVSRTWGGGS